VSTMGTCYTFAMFIQVKLLNGFKEPLWYTVPPDTAAPAQKFVGAIVQVPIQKRVTPGIVVHQQAEKPNVSFNIRAIERWEEFPADMRYWQFLNTLAAYHVLEPAYLVQRLKGFLQNESIQTQVTHAQTQTKLLTNTNRLTKEQEVAYQAIHNDLQVQKYQTTVLHGVTGSGKTEVYKKLIIDAWQQHKTTFFLVPEVTLAVSFYARLKAQLPPEIPIYSFHSASPMREKKQLWSALLEGTPVLIIGVHLPLLLPITQLGLIIVDEEHEVGYQEKRYPYINSKEAAIMRAHLYKIPIVLGSATPSLRSLYNVEHRAWRLCTLSERYAGNFPKIKVVNLRAPQQRPCFWISNELYDAIRERLHKKEQIILFLNRRGFSFFVQCGGCGSTIQCKNCSVSLTLHEDEMLYCHYCPYKCPTPELCPHCKGAASQFLKRGIGTQKVCALLSQLFPKAIIARADLDSTRNKKKWQSTITDFQAGKIDMLIGTQTITKGYDFPGVTLVGVIWADLNLHFPQYNATETTLQQLIQVAGRAGRHSTESLVIVQTMSNHGVFSYVDELSYANFCVQELRSRKEFGYPPYKHLALITIQHTQISTVERDAYAMVTTLVATRDRMHYGAEILGPAKPPVHKIQRLHVREIYVKSEHMQEIITLYARLNHAHCASTLQFIPSVV